MTDGQPLDSTQPVYREGRVKFYNIVKGFGFIVDIDSSDEFFVHATGVIPNDDGRPRVLYDGEYVRFQTRPDERNGENTDVCFDVTGHRGGPLLCDSNSRLSQNNRRQNISA
jgi:CspA family cold shock protein